MRNKIRTDTCNEDIMEKRQKAESRKREMGRRGESGREIERKIGMERNRAKKERLGLKV